jgi:hypothetical protein
MMPIAKRLKKNKLRINGKIKLMPEKEVYPIRNCAGCGDPIFLDKGNYIQFVSTSQIKWYTHKDCFTKSLNKGLSDWLEIEMNSYFRRMEVH